MDIKPIKIIGPLFTSTQFKDTKDPCIVFDGSIWHIYGSGGDVRNEKWNILHATATDIEGPWHEVEPVTIQEIQGDHVAAPSVWFGKDDQIFHMTVQTEFVSVGGNIEYLQSRDGNIFTHVSTILHAVPNSGEAGIYDPHQTVYDNKKYLVYAGTSAIEGFNNTYIIQPDIYAAVSESSWQGTWKRLGKILDHEDIDWHHNSRHHKEYEWGIEGPQLVFLPNGKVLLNATCFLSEGTFGTRQRVFFAVADTVTDPYTSLGPMLIPDKDPDTWQSGENGHASAIIQDDRIYLFHQARSRKFPVATDNNWQYGIAVFSLKDFLQN